MHGLPRAWEIDAEQTEAGLDANEQERLRLLVAQSVLAQKAQGDMPAGWVRWAELIIQPKVNWRDRLLRRLRGAITEGNGARLNYSYRHPHRRSAQFHPLVLPSLRGQYQPRIACVVDTSGSISDRELGQALAEVRGVLLQLHVPVTVVPCDAVPYEAIQVFTLADWSVLSGQMRGGGGTDMVAGIEACLQLQPPPDAVLVLTDGYTPFPEQTYAVPVVFAIWDTGGAGDVPKPPIPPWSQRDVVIVPLS